MSRSGRETVPGESPAHSTFPLCERPDDAHRVVRAQVGGEAPVKAVHTLADLRFRLARQLSYEGRRLWVGMCGLLDDCGDCPSKFHLAAHPVGALTQLLVGIRGGEALGDQRDHIGLVEPLAAQFGEDLAWCRTRRRPWTLPHPLPGRSLRSWWRCTHARRTDRERPGRCGPWRKGRRW